MCKKIICNTTINDNVFYVNIILQFLLINNYTLNNLLIIFFFQLAYNYISEEFMVKDLQVDSFRLLVFVYIRAVKGPVQRKDLVSRWHIQSSQKSICADVFDSRIHY